MWGWVEKLGNKTQSTSWGLQEEKSTEAWTTQTRREPESKMTLLETSEA